MAGMMPTYDYETEQANLARRQKLVDAMMQQGNVPIQTYTAGNMTAKISPFEVIAKALAPVLATRKQKQLDAERNDLGQRYAQDLRTGMEQYEKTASGYQLPDSGGPTPEGPAINVPGQQVPGNPKQAIFEAIASNHPVLRDFGLMQLKEQGKGQLTPKDLSALATPESVLTNPNDPRQWVGRKEIKFAQPGEVGYDESGRITNLKPAKEGGGQGWSTVTINGDLYQASPTGLKKLDNAPKINVNTSVVNKGESKFMEKLGELSAEDVVKAKQAKVSAQRTIQAMDKLEALDRQGAYSGPAADMGVVTGNLAEAIGWPIDKKKLATSRDYQGEVAGQLTQYLTGSLAKSTTDADMKILKQPMPQLLDSPEGRAALRRQAKAKAMEQIEYANQVDANLNSRFPEAGRLMGVTPGVVDVPRRNDLPTAGGNSGGRKVIKWGDL